MAEFKRKKVAIETVGQYPHYYYTAINIGPVRSITEMSPSEAKRFAYVWDIDYDDFRFYRWTYLKGRGVYIVQKGCFVSRESISTPFCAVIKLESATNTIENIDRISYVEFRD
jgi:hypothetical protein